MDLRSIGSRCFYPKTCDFETSHNIIEDFGGKLLAVLCLQAPDALTAVAFQDHLLKSMNVNLSLTGELSSKRNLNKRLAYKKPKGKSVVDCHRSSKSDKGELL